VFRRSKSEAAPVAPEPKGKAGGKGRPTPTRREAEAARKAAFKKPRNKREAAAQRRERSRAERVKVQEAMKTGDERYLPAADKGPARKFARDYVDARYSLMEFALPVLLVVALGGILLTPRWPAIAPLVNLFFLFMILAIAIDWFVLTRGLKSKLRARQPGADTRGVSFYAIRRTMQMRRWRMPKPTVDRGTKL
jgi:Protein of unknown function (DUF3043)